MDKPLIIGISGISGAGKTTVGKIIAKELEGIFLDQDWFFKKKKPLVKLSNGEVVIKYDDDAALDIDRMNQNIRNKFNLKKPIILAGFALRDYFFELNTRPTIHFHIKIPRDLSAQTRLKVKKFSPRALENEKFMFNEIVYPYYLETLEKSKIDYLINGLNENGTRRNLGNIVSEILKQIKLNQNSNIL